MKSIFGYREINCYYATKEETSRGEYKFKCCNPMYCIYQELDVDSNGDVCAFCKQYSDVDIVHNVLKGALA